MYRRYFKRALDLIFSIIAIIILAPLFILIAVLIKIILGGPVIFKQQRPGKDERLFTLYKFRTMSEARDQNGNLLPDSERLNSFGKMLRSTSLDELPELINVIKGEMSLVGPRPLAIEYLPYYDQQQRKRHAVLPGITGLAQVNGRNAIMWEQRFAYDLSYVENISLSGDLKIMLVTLFKVFQRSDIGSRKEDDSDRGIEDFDIYTLRKQFDIFKNDEVMKLRSEVREQYTKRGLKDKTMSGIGVAND